MLSLGDASQAAAHANAELSCAGINSKNVWIGALYQLCKALVSRALLHLQMESPPCLFLRTNEKHECAMPALAILYSSVT